MCFGLRCVCVCVLAKPCVYVFVCLIAWACLFVCVSIYVLYGGGVSLRVCVWLSVCRCVSSSA